MIDWFDTPVVVILFNRPDHLDRLLSVLRTARPSRMFVIADGPRRGHRGDQALCRASREVLNAVDWPCTVEREFSDVNLGCDRRVQSGLDWAFSRVDRAVVLEDDILPDPSFFGWAQCMLDRFGADEDFSMASGHNPLGRWGPAGADNLRVRRGSIWGWATTANAWRRIRAVDLSGRPDAARDDLAKLDLDPLVEEHYGLSLRAFRESGGTAWDVAFSLRMLLRRDRAVTSSVNMMKNTGFGSSATRTSFPDDFNQLVPVHPAIRLTEPSEERDDPSFDRASLVVQLLGRCVNPSMALRLANLLAAGRQLPIDPGIRHHLAPFGAPREAVELLDHLSAQGVTSPHFERVRGVLRQAAEVAAQ